MVATNSLCMVVMYLIQAVPAGAVAATSAQVPISENPSARCESLRALDLSMLPDAPTQVMTAHLVSPDQGATGYCEVGGYVAPSVGFLLQLPADHWNGKLVELGCGGTCGSTAHVSGCKGPMSRGYACIVSDGGNRSTGLDMKWAYNRPQAVIEYWVRASHVTAMAGKSIAERYYSQAPQKSYFMGCSAGGIQAMWEAQKFPWDFDGIVAGAPALNLTGNWMNFVWADRALTGRNAEGLLSQVDLEVLHEAVVEKCDLNDGIKDGIIGDPRACHFDPAELRCTATRAKQCLTKEQVEAVEKIYRGPVTSKGEQIVLPTAMRGSERSWGVFSGSVTHPSAFHNYIGEWFRYYFFQPNPGPTWEPKDFDFDHDYKRLGIAEVTEPVNPDLRRFKARGGKLLSFTGWNDALEGVLRTVDYYESAEKLSGGRAPTQDFFRLFVIPGMDHCSRGDGAFAVDYLSYLEAWAERGAAPDKIVGAHLRPDDVKNHDDADLLWGLKFPLDTSKVEFSRPVYPYPTMARYLGHGDPSSAASFGPVQP